VADIKLEVCVDDIAGLNSALAGGADRIELCSALSIGGLTPTSGLCKIAGNSPVPIYAMIRPREGDFQYTQTEIDSMRHDIDMVRNAGLAGVVLGVLRSDNRLDVESMETLLRHAIGLGATLHRAFDLVPDFTEAIETAIGLGFERVLTSGGQRTAVDGIGILKQLHNQANGRIIIMAGSGVSVGSAPEILKSLPICEMHASCSTVLDTAQSKLIEFGFCRPDRRRASANSVAAFKKVLRS
jgi:copper homeostasis protein